MKEFNWNMQYMSWDDCKDGLLQGKGDKWEKLEQADLVFGGINFSSDFL
jgi:hypothetical protein